MNNHIRSRKTLENGLLYMFSLAYAPEPVEGYRPFPNVLNQRVGPDCRVRRSCAPLTPGQEVTISRNFLPFGIG